MTITIGILFGGRVGVQQRAGVEPAYARRHGSIWQHAVHRSHGTSTGELDMSAAPEMTRLLGTEPEQPGTTTVRADLDAVTFIDSSMITVLITARRAAIDAGRRFTICGAHGPVRRVLDVTGILQAPTAESDPTA